jgi:uncharacterized protein (TIGR03437 family)
MHETGFQRNASGSLLRSLQLYLLTSSDKRSARAEKKASSFKKLAGREIRIQSHFLRVLYLASLCVPVCAQGQTISGYTIGTFAGTNVRGFAGDGAAASAAQLGGPTGLFIDGSGNLFFVDSFNQRIREITSGGIISTYAGNGTAGYTGDLSAATKAEISSASAVAVDSSGNAYIADTANNVVRKVAAGTISTFAGNNAAGFGYNGDLQLATNAQLFSPIGVTVDSKGNLYIADTGNSRIRMVPPDGSNIDTFAGNNVSGYLGDGKPAIYAQLFDPQGIVFDSAGNLYIADTGNHRIRKVDTNGIITTVAGSSSVGGFGGDGGPATSARLYFPTGLAVDTAGNLFIADSLNSRIRKVSPNGTITTVAGNGSQGYSGDGGSSTDAALYFPVDVKASGGKVYISDTQNNVIRVLTPVLSAPPVVSSVLNASAYGGGSSIGAGSYIEIYGSNLAASMRSWTSADFNGATAPNSLDGVTVTVGGQAAFVAYISPTQINALVPASVGLGAQPVMVTTSAGTSASFTATVNATQPGLYAPSSLNIGGKQYVGAFFPDFVTAVTPSKPAKAGDTIVLFGLGFGAVTPPAASGQMVQQSNALVSPVQVLFNQTPATVTYQGLSPGSVGLYQFNVVVPSVDSSAGPVALTFSQGGASGTQTLYIAVAN